MLQIRQLETGYGKRQVLFGTSLDVRAGEIVALIGANGAGKSTVLRAVCGLIPPWKGEILFEGVRLRGSTRTKNLKHGISFCPQGNRVFDELTVMENLQVGGLQLSKKDLRIRIEEVLGLFPGVKGRIRQQAGTLSGGEQQMLAFARALVPKPRLLMLDEPSLGLSPNLVTTVFDRIVQINRETGVTVLIVEQKVHDVLRIATRVYGLRLGVIAIESSPAEILAGDNLKRLFLG